MKRLVYILLLLCPFTLFGQDLYVTDSSVTHYLTDSSQTYYIYHDLSEQALLYLDGTVSTINNKIDTIFDENNNFNAIQTDTLKSPSLTDGAWELDGVDDYVDFGDNSNLELQNFTISCWYKKDTLGLAGWESLIAIQVDVSSNRGYSGVLLRESFSNTFQLWASLGTNSPETITTTETIADTDYHHVSVTKNGTNISIYIDGSLSKTDTFTNGNIDYTGSTARSLIGSYWDGSEAIGYFNGSIDEVMIFDRPLQPSEILELYQRCVTIGGILNCD